MTPNAVAPVGAVRLTEDEACSLRRVASLMIPASESYQVPGADDEKIFADVLGSLDREGPAVKEALRQLSDLAGRPFVDLPAHACDGVLTRFRAQSTALADALVRVIARCYYRDDRVMLSIGMEPRPPFPKGFELEQGDWSLLEPVRMRGKIFRDAP